MLITRLRLLGFKSFVDPIELVIEPGLTGVVGPNGCGKSNLLEALRWVMGETSYKSMRASAMDDVIFSGTTGRPARNMAEVTIFIDNSQRLAPAEFNDSDTLEIVRRIEREAGSAYRINGREARARDIKILFEDAATGARSPALVRQGQIGEIVNAKPEQRRRILEDAAGTAGLHSRRHDAELRLKAAENNLARLGDILGQMSSQIESLRRQARQAKRYAELSDAIRRAEAAALHLRWVKAAADVDAEEEGYRVAQAELGAATGREAAALAREAELAQCLQPLREAEAAAAAALARLTHERDVVLRDAAAAETRVRELAEEQTRIAADMAREHGHRDEAAAMIAEVEETVAALEDRLTEAAMRETEIGELADAQARRVADLEQQTTVARSVAAERASAIRSADALLAERRRQAADVQQAVERLDAEHGRLSHASPDTGSAEAIADEVASAEATVEIIEAEIEGRLDDQDRLRAHAEATRTEQQRASLELKAIEAEVATLSKLIAADPGRAQRIVDLVTVADGYERALGAALGDDLEAGLDDPSATASWRSEIGSGDDDGLAPLPDGAEPLADFVEAPQALSARLAMTGVVEVGDGPRLQAVLAPGQRLVSRAGDLWRWDGFFASASAPSAAAKRLVERGRLAQAEERLERADQLARKAAEATARAVASERDADHAVAALRDRAKTTAQQLAAARLRLAQAEREAGLHSERVAALELRRAEARVQATAAGERLAEAERKRESLPEADPEADGLAEIEAALVAARAELSRLSADRGGIEREARLVRERLMSVRADRSRWDVRQRSAAEQILRLGERAESVAEQAVLAGAQPAELRRRAERIADELVAAEANRRARADELATVQSELSDAGKALRSHQGEVATAREARARCETRLETVREARTACVRVITETFEVSPEACAAIAELTGPSPEPTALPAEIAKAETKLARLRGDRERLGGVNLQAAAELSAIETEFDTLDAERRDVEAAIAKLRGGIAQLNREGRKRLLTAFESVNKQFVSLFTTLFGGGEARLELVEADDPLESGLEIIAKPPGKKPTTLSLLSGGEQTLTALSLIFAVFLTNPSPICVLDEVDAPLDDANVDRFCTLMESMAERTATRFLVITHHPMTMARMHRLFGVTMAERGVSQLVSVDLSIAERFLEAS